MNKIFFILLFLLLIVILGSNTVSSADSTDIAEDSGSYLSISSSTDLEIIDETESNSPTSEEIISESSSQIAGNEISSVSEFTEDNSDLNHRFK